jgi:hypothetical protein
MSRSIDKAGFTPSEKKNIQYDSNAKNFTTQSTMFKSFTINKKEQ